MDMTGKIIDGKYKIIKLVGSGGMAKVYKALDIRLDRYVAVKVLKEDYADNEQFVKKFMREAQADAKLAHPNIVNVYDVGSNNGVNYIVMEYMDGPTLNDYLDEKGVLSAQETVDIIYSIALGLNHAHANKIIHRDIKPHNILMTTTHMPKVADFGIAMAVSSSTQTVTEDGLGSVHYVSPEQAKGGFLDERSDLYSLGIMMYEMLTGELPYDGDSPVAVALMHVQNSVPNPKLINKRIPDGVAQVVLNLTRKKPEERYQNARALLDSLRKLKANINADIDATYKSGPKASTAKAGNKPKAPEKKTVKKTFSLKKVFENKKNLKWVITAAVVIAVIIAVILLTPPKMVEVPNFVGLNETQAEKLADEKNVKINITKHVNSPTVAENLIAQQLTEAGTQVEARTVIELYMSIGPKIVEVPNVVDKYEAEAVADMKKKNFEVKNIIYEFNSEYEKNVVYQQNPAAGTQAAEGTEVTLYVSKGKDTTSVPKLLGYSLDVARDALRENNLVMGSITYDSSSTYEKGTIMKQSPTAYSVVDKNTAIDVVVSLGRETTRTITVNLARYASEADSDTVSLRIELQNINDGYDNVYSRDGLDKKEVVNVEVSGIGDKIYNIYVNGIKVGDGVVSF